MGGNRLPSVSERNPEHDSRQSRPAEALLRDVPPLLVRFVSTTHGPRDIQQTTSGVDLHHLHSHHGAGASVKKTPYGQDARQFVRRRPEPSRADGLGLAWPRRRLGEVVEEAHVPCIHRHTTSGEGLLATERRQPRYSRSHDSMRGNHDSINARFYNTCRLVPGPFGPQVCPVVGWPRVDSQPGSAPGAVPTSHCAATPTAQ